MQQYIKEALNAWIKTKLVPRKSFNYKTTSYGLKHKFSYELGETTGKGSGSYYITNDEFKLAMIENGYEPSDAAELNPHYKIYIRTDRKHR